jgi:hypothetical protein
VQREKGRKTVHMRSLRKRKEVVVVVVVVVVWDATCHSLKGLWRSYGESATEYSKQAKGFASLYIVRT